LIFACLSAASHISLLLHISLHCFTNLFQLRFPLRELLLTLSFASPTSNCCFFHFFQLLSYLSLLLFAHLSFIFLITHSCFLHHSHLPLAYLGYLSLIFAHFSVDSLTSFHVSCISFSCFSYLLSCSSHLLICLSHISLLPLALLYCLLHFPHVLLASFSDAYLSSICCFQLAHLLLLPSVFDSITSFTYFSHLSLLLPLRISIASHTFFGCFSCFRPFPLLTLSITSYTLNSCFFHFFELFLRLSLLLPVPFSVSSPISQLPLVPLSVVS
jgi:hypothetical protein